LPGKVVLVKAEEDGDLHIQLGDPDGKSKMEVVVEVPVDNNDPNSAWSKIRKTVFGWSNQEFPFVAGAQTERRGGAGPAGACLVVRIPPAALFCGFRRTFLQTVL